VLKKSGEVLAVGMACHYPATSKDIHPRLFSIEQWNCSIFGYVNEPGTFSTE
jgi:hypothetical protein